MTRLRPKIKNRLHEIHHKTLVATTHLATKCLVGFAKILQGKENVLMYLYHSKRKLSKKISLCEINGKSI